MTSIWSSAEHKTVLVACNTITRPPRYIRQEFRTRIPRFLGLSLSLITLCLSVRGLPMVGMSRELAAALKFTQSPLDRVWETHRSMSKLEKSLSIVSPSFKGNEPLLLTLTTVPSEAHRLFASYSQTFGELVYIAVCQSLVGERAGEQATGHYFALHLAIFPCLITSCLLPTFLHSTQRFPLRTRNFALPSNT